MGGCSPSAPDWMSLESGMNVPAESEVKGQVVVAAAGFSLSMQTEDTKYHPDKLPYRVGLEMARNAGHMGSVTPGPSGEQQSSCASSVQSSSSSSSPVKSSSCNPSISPLRTGPLPADLDDLKVSELRQQLRMRGLAVSGTKTALIERLRPFRDSSCASPAAFPVTPTGSLSSCHFYRFCSSGSTPPISPASSELSVSSFSDATVSSPQFGLSADEGPDPEKDKMLVEKQKVIEELRWKLQQEQRQVEELRLQLHKRKRMQDCPAPPQHMTHLQQFYSVSVKQEQMKGGCMAHCDLLELHSSGSPAGLSALLSPQCSPEDPPVTKPSSSPPSPDSHTLLQNASRATRSTQASEQKDAALVSVYYSISTVCLCAGRVRFPLDVFTRGLSQGHAAV
ncbi:myocardin-like [Sinocyclocheilus grahami]|uniref:myocardin-like n=1 Tax=Sinocyclocheilus grahami TaxID=75366 RepID=UPI0007ACE10A|nr:PREDICTED: myocardin-like [Sinocyclocheilus grahami]